MTINIQAAIYARVSSEQQAAANTIASQLAALRERLAKDGLPLQSELEFIDEGYSGATLVRPALEKLRDLIAFGSIDRLYVHSPDRLARKYAYQVLLVDEFQRAGVEVIFLNRELGRSPEDELLLQVQGMTAEYERAKIIERHRRGKRRATHAGSVNVIGGAPYGYRYVTFGLSSCPPIMNYSAASGSATFSTCVGQAPRPLPPLNMMRPFGCTEDTTNSSTHSRCSPANSNCWRTRTRSPGLSWSRSRAALFWMNS